MSRGSDIYIERLREKVQSAAGGVKDASKHLEDLTKVKQHARAQIRDAERLLKMSEQKEQQVKAQLVIFKTEVSFRMYDTITRGVCCCLHIKKNIQISPQYAWYRIKVSYVRQKIAQSGLGG